MFYFLPWTPDVTGGWVVGERKENRILYLSRRFATQDEAVVERDRMSALPQYQGRELEVTYWQTEPKKKRRLARQA
jgi:hypothetical protein